MLQLPHIKARIARLHEVTRGLCKEIVVIGDAEDPLLYLERRAYLAAIHRRGRRVGRGPHRAGGRGGEDGEAGGGAADGLTADAAYQAGKKPAASRKMLAWRGEMGRIIGAAPQNHWFGEPIAGRRAPVDLRHAKAPHYPHLHLITVTICGVSTIACFLAPCINAWIEEQTIHKGTGLHANLLITAAGGLVFASPFAALYVLSLLARQRLIPSGATLAGAVLAGGMVMLIFTGYCAEAVEVWRTGASPERYTGNWRGMEFLALPFVEWSFGLPAFLLLYGLGWLGSVWAPKGWSSEEVPCGDVPGFSEHVKGLAHRPVPQG